MGLFCVPFDSIPAIDDPTFVPASEADFLPAAEPVAVVEIGGEDRAYPIRILITHEVVNDVVAGRPIVVWRLLPLGLSSALTWFGISALVATAVAVATFRTELSPAAGQGAGHSAGARSA